MSQTLSQSIAFLSTKPPLPDQSILGPTDVNWDAPLLGDTFDIQYTASGIFTLPPGYLYELDAIIVPATPVFDSANFFWVDSTNSVLPGFNVGGRAVDGTLAHIHALARFRPLISTAVHVRQTELDGTIVVSALFSSVRISVIG